MTGSPKRLIAALLASLSLLISACATPGQTQQTTAPSAGGTPAPIVTVQPDASPGTTDDDDDDDDDRSPGASDDDDDDDESPSASDDDDDDDDD